MAGPEIPCPGSEVLKLITLRSFNNFNSILALVMPTPVSSAKRQTAELRGRHAEASVAALWQSQGFSVLAQRLRTKSGEIDLIVANPSTLVFVEVKARNTFAEAAYSVLPRQQNRLIQAATSALAAHEDWHRPNMRFDIALVCNGCIEHIEDAIRQT